MLRYLYFKI